MADKSRDAPFDTGDRIAEKYEVKGLLGRGGHAFVFDCWDTFMDQEVAIKVIDPPNKGRDLLRRAKEEAKLLFRLDHPNVVRVITAAELHDGMVYIVMEKLDGMVLRKLLVRLGRLNVVEALSIALHVAEGVAAAHALGVIHRDLKPDNVMILPPDESAPDRNRVKVLDFGIAKFMGQDGLQTTEKDLLHGTPAYMSPEHLLGFGVTVRSDVYQLGSILFELLVGRPPILVDVEDPTFDQLCAMQIHRITPNVTKLVPEVPDYVTWLVDRATAKDAQQRFESMEQFAKAISSVLERYLSSAPREARRVRLLEVTPRPSAAGANTGFESAPAAPRRLDTPEAPSSSVNTATLPSDTEPMSRPAFSDPSGIVALASAKAPRESNPPEIHSTAGGTEPLPRTGASRGLDQGNGASALLATGARTAPQFGGVRPQGRLDGNPGESAQRVSTNTASPLSRTIPRIETEQSIRSAPNERASRLRKLILSAVGVGTVLGVFITIAVPREKKVDPAAASTASASVATGTSEHLSSPQPFPANAEPSVPAKEVSAPASSSAAARSAAESVPAVIASPASARAAPSRAPAKPAAAAPVSSTQSDVDRVRNRLRMLDQDAKQPIYGGGPMIGDE